MYCIALLKYVKNMTKVPGKKEVIKKLSRAWVGLVQQKNQKLGWDYYSKNIKGLGGVRTAFLSKLPCYF